MLIRLPDGEEYFTFKPFNFYEVTCVNSCLNSSCYSLVFCRIHTVHRVCRKWMKLYKKGINRGTQTRRILKRCKNVCRNLEVKWMKHPLSITLESLLCTVMSHNFLAYFLKAWTFSCCLGPLMIFKAFWFFQYQLGVVL